MQVENLLSGSLCVLRRREKIKIKKRTRKNPLQVCAISWGSCSTCSWTKFRETTYEGNATSYHAQVGNLWENPWSLCTRQCKTCCWECLIQRLQNEAKEKFWRVVVAATTDPLVKTSPLTHLGMACRLKTSSEAACVSQEKRKNKNIKEKRKREQGRTPSRIAQFLEGDAQLVAGPSPEKQPVRGMQQAILHRLAICKKTT